MLNEKQIKTMETTETKTERFRIVFSPNGLKPFIWESKKMSYEKAASLFNTLCLFDLGNITLSQIKDSEYLMIQAYKAYRRRHGINHPDMISFSSGTIDQLGDDNIWWVVSEYGNETPDYEIGEIEGYTEEN